MIEIIKEHLQKYSQMQIQDIAKLLYQSEFGGGHLIADANRSLERIRAEYEALDDCDKTAEMKYESIGDGMYRVHLSCLTEAVSAELLNRMFVASANHRKGTVKGLEEKIAACLKVCEAGEMPFSCDDMKAHFTEWKAEGYPAKSHTEIYRQNYHPAYRVMEEAYVSAIPYIKEIEEKQSKIIGIEGMCGAGKSTLAEVFHAVYPESNLFHADDYFLQPHQRTEERLTEVGGNLDRERMKEEIFDHLHDKNGIAYRRFDCSRQELLEPVHVPYKEMVIIEGSYCQHPYFGEPYDLKIFLQISKEEQKKRIIERNGEKMWKRFEEEWIPKELAYFEAYKLKIRNKLIAW